MSSTEIVTQLIKSPIIAIILLAMVGAPVAMWFSLNQYVEMNEKMAQQMTANRESLSDWLNSAVAKGSETDRRFIEILAEIRTTTNQINSRCYGRGEHNELEPRTAPTRILDAPPKSAR